MNVRPSVRELFLALRRLEIYFYTSNLPKYLQAKTFFDRSGLFLHQFKSKTDPYSEDYKLGKHRLLTMAIREILGSVGQGSLFFVEDTSLRIEVLSDTEDFPGLAVKEWFERTTFEDLDKQLGIGDHDRAVVVKSDIALHIPGLKRPVFFEGTTSGRIANTPPSFPESAEYPWLTPNTFNGWFIPDGHGKRLGEMSLEESWDNDFRIKAFAKVVERLEEYAAALNLPPQAYTRRERRSTSATPLLFPEKHPVYIVVGKTCAGKTTFGMYASRHHGIQFIEASAVLRTLKSEYDDFQVEGFPLAEKLLSSQGADVVARKIMDLYAPIDQTVVIAGFRTIEELEVMRKEFPEALVVLIEASERARFHRYLTRKRAPQGLTLADFTRHDADQWRFGLLRVAEDFADIRLTNEGSIKDYCLQIDAIIGGTDLRGMQGVATQLQPRHPSDTNQLYRCLRTLIQADRPLTCQEIQEESNEPGKILIRPNNANKVLKRVPELAERLESDNMSLRYRILNAGRAYVRLMDQRRPS